jgi:hypothetical protein
MATIAQLPDTPRFNIKHVAEQTGILPVTLRASTWPRCTQMAACAARGASKIVSAKWNATAWRR